MKKILKNAVGGLFILAILGVASSSSGGAPSLTYVYSESMEPLIMTNDAFIVWPEKNPEVGDIVVFRPSVLEAQYITHRIIGEVEEGFITKGDNSPYTDQSSGEPPIKPSRIVGRVVTIGGSPLVIPQLGVLSEGLQDLFSDNARIFSGIFLGLAILNLLVGTLRSPRRRRPRNRWRLMNVYRGIGITAVLIVVLSVYYGSQVKQVDYLVSESPGTLGDQVKRGEAGQLSIQAENNGLIPVWFVADGLEPFRVDHAPRVIWPLSEVTVMIDVLPQENTGRYMGYVRVFNYPALLPRSWLLFFHRINPFFGILSVGAALGFWLFGIFSILDRTPGFYAWIPLKAIKDKMFDRRLRRKKLALLGRKRL
ncbi:MAG: hypothetical protein AVO33_11175 [delta proteobacterium ML8_F1]|nr:MAG: hypothetical protein AVO33_11175 [delta proteobacterium ML8_F1]